MKFLSDDVLDHLRDVVDEPDLAETKYRLVRRVGEGGMGTVYEAEDVELDRRVALKVGAVEPARDLAERLRLEARVIARLEHPGIVPVHDVGVLPDGRIYYVMKLVRGQRLDAWLRATPRPSRTVALRLFQRVCEALAFAHAHGVVHLDVKPDNVMVGAFGEALVMDWGLAREIDAPAPKGAVIGTSGFMAPEQARGGGDPLGARADVHGLGATLRYVLDVLDAHDAHHAPRRLRSICERATAEEPQARYASAGELADDVGRFLEDLPVSAHRETLPERAARLASRHRVVLTLFAAYLVVRLALAVFAR